MTEVILIFIGGLGDFRIYSAMCRVQMLCIVTLATKSEVSYN